MQLKNLLKDLQGLTNAAKTSENEAARVITEETISLITFRVDTKIFAIDIDNANEIIKISKVSIVPNVASWIVGVTNLRGEIIPIYDVIRKFKLKTTHDTDNEVVQTHAETEKKKLADLCGQTAIVVNVDGMSFALLIDEILKTIAVPVSKISLNPALLNTLGNEYIKGIVRRGKDDSELLMILNLEKLAEG